MVKTIQLPLTVHRTERYIQFKCHLNTQNTLKWERAFVQSTAQEGSTRNLSYLVPESEKEREWVLRTVEQQVR